MQKPNGDPQSVRLVIQANPDGSVSLSGPLDNRTLCYGMLEMAKDALQLRTLQNAGYIKSQKPDIMIARPKLSS